MFSPASVKLQNKEGISQNLFCVCQILMCEDAHLTRAVFQIYFLNPFHHFVSVALLSSSFAYVQNFSPLNCSAGQSVMLKIHPEQTF